MATGHLIIRFDQKRPSATFVWLDTGEAMKVTYMATVDRVMHLATPDQRRHPASPDTPQQPAPWTNSAQ